MQVKTNIIEDNELNGCVLEQVQDEAGGTRYRIRFTESDREQMDFATIVEAADAWGSVTRAARRNPHLDPDVFTVIAWAREDVAQMIEREFGKDAITEANIDAAIDQIGDTLQDRSIEDGWETLYCIVSVMKLS